MQRTISLLEQCVLYSNSDYQPFHGRPVPDNLPLADPNPDHENQTVQPASAESNSTNNTNEVLTSALVSIDLDFDISLSEEHSIITPATPLAKSTSRRSGHAKSRSSCRCRSCKDLVHLRGSTKPKTIAKVIRHEQPHEQLHLPSAPQNGYDFLSLPGEVRDSIYAHLFAQARLHITQNQRSPQRFDLHQSIRWTCRKVYLETARPFFNNLSVTLDFYDFKTDALKPIGKIIPECIRTKLQYLTIITPNLPTDAVDSDMIELGEIPSLQYLKLIESEFLLERRNRHRAAIHLCVALARARLMFQPSNLEQQHWFRRLSHQHDRLYKMGYEAEIHCTSIKDRSPQMGILKRNHHSTYVISRLQDTKDEVSTTYLKPIEFRQRHKIYCRMEKDGDLGRYESHAFRVLRRLKDMEYHETLDKIEAATAKITSKTTI